MPSPYKAIVDHNGFTPDVLTNKIHFAMPPGMGAVAQGCPGRTIIAAAGANGLYHDPFLKLFFTFSRYPGPWTWNGVAGGSSMTGLLDDPPDARTTGECLHFVKNLYVLCRAPAPYGLGMAANEVLIMPAYEGAFGKGFVSVHNGVFHNLASNVVAGPGYAGPPLYSWENHKVLWLRSRDLYFDPSYGTSYQDLEDMAEYHYTGKEVIMDGSKDLAKAFNAGRYAYQASRAGRLYYFRLRSQAEKLASPTRTIQGPYTETEFELACMAARGLQVI